jgi:hypothetical protein
MVDISGEADKGGLAAHDAALETLSNTALAERRNVALTIVNLPFKGLNRLVCK